MNPAKCCHSWKCNKYGNFRIFKTLIFFVPWSFPIVGIEKHGIRDIQSFRKKTKKYRLLLNLIKDSLSWQYRKYRLSRKSRKNSLQSRIMCVSETGKDGMYLAKNFWERLYFPCGKKKMDFWAVAHDVLMDARKDRLPSPWLQACACV